MARPAARDRVIESALHGRDGAVGEEPIGRQPEKVARGPVGRHAAAIVIEEEHRAGRRVERGGEVAGATRGRDVSGPGRDRTRRAP
jgi:hypothetical protein